MSRSLHQLVAMTNRNKVTRVPSRTCSTCHQDVICQYKNQNGAVTTMNPICTILGPTLCKNCSLLIHRQQRIVDTKRILSKFSEPIRNRQIKEQALLSKIKEQLNDEDRVDCSRYGNDIRTADTFEDGGYRARNNTPDILYLESRRSTYRNRQRQHQPTVGSSFCQKPIRDTLQTLAMKMADRYFLKGVGGKNNELSGVNVTLQTTSRNRLFLPELVENESYFSPAHTTVVAMDEPAGNKMVVDDEYDFTTDNNLKLNSSYIDDDELHHKLTSVYEQRHLPPLNLNRCSSTASSLDDVDENDGNSSTADSIPASPKSDDEIHLTKSEREIPEKSCYSETIANVSPVLLDVKSQLSRQHMFSNFEGVVPNDGKKIKVDQRNVPLLRIKRPSKK